MRSEDAREASALARVSSLTACPRTEHPASPSSRVRVRTKPFGCIGHSSGLGRYHGREGFCTFSNGRSIAEVGRISTNLVLRPPYGDRLKRLFAYQVESALKANELKKRAL